MDFSMHLLTFMQMRSFFMREGVNRRGETSHIKIITVHENSSASIYFIVVPYDSDQQYDSASMGTRTRSTR